MVRSGGEPEMIVGNHHRLRKSMNSYHAKIAGIWNHCRCQYYQHHACGLRRIQQSMRRLRPFAFSRLQSRFRWLYSIPPASSVRAVTFKYLQHSGLSTAAPPSDLGLDRKRTAQSTEAGVNGKHLRVCVVGSGPAGFYVTKYLLKVGTAV